MAVRKGGSYHTESIVASVGMKPFFLEVKHFKNIKGGRHIFRQSAEVLIALLIGISCCICLLLSLAWLPADDFSIQSNSWRLHGHWNNWYPCYCCLLWADEFLQLWFLWVEGNSLFHQILHVTNKRSIPWPCIYDNDTRCNNIYYLKQMSVMLGA